MSRQADGRSTVWPAWVIPGGLAVLFTVLVLFRPERLQLAGAAFAAAIVVLGLYPVLRFLRASEPEPLPFFAALGVFYAVFFGFSAFLVDIIWPNGEPIFVYLMAPGLQRLSDEAMAAMFLGASSLLVVGLVANKAFRRILPPLPISPARSEGVALGVAWVALGIHFTGLLIPALRSLPSVGQLIIPLGNLGFGILLLLALNGQMRRSMAIMVFGVLLAVRVVIGGQTGSMASILLLPAFLGFLALVRNRRMGIIIVLVICAVVSFGYAPLNQVRAVAAAESPMPLARFAEVFRELPERLSRLDNFSGKVAERCNKPLPFRAHTPATPAEYQACLEVETGPSYVPPTDQGGWALVATVLRQAVKRVNQTAMFALVYEQTPSRVPYWGGDTLRPLLTSMVPRAVWPGKPEERAGQAFGWRYGLITDRDGDMSVNLSWLVEAFANFGWLGLVVVMGLAGLVLALLDAVLNRRGMGSLQLAVGATVLFPLVNQESNLSLTFGATVPLLLALAFLVRFVTWAGQRMAR
ncbi:MAG: hypothetical protein H7Z12_11105 [Rhodospirillaceae bacterium]|nr:hypothetical protein [Rhodospirillales bacterium]